MKQYLLLLTVVILIACNSGKKDEPTTTTTVDTTVATIKTDSIPPATTTGKIDIESFGPLKLGMPYKELVAAVGHPGKKGEAVLWAADGLVHQDWTYPAEGLVLNVSFEKDALLQTGKLFTITATAPNSYKTAAGFAIGSSYSEVEAAYKKDIDPEATDKTQITVGSVYGGIIFSFTNDRASKI
ncbi:MAG TPA: hypothetical protein VMZ03_12840, partial [Chitinophagaceae bacterium]|nr:hypothetical protein [Chitinophagaceae bacterium]